MNFFAQLLPRFISEAPSAVRKTVYAVLTILGAVLLVDYKFAAGSSVPWVNSHVVSAAVLAWYVFIVTPVLTMAHQKVGELSPWENDLFDAVTPELANAAAPAADIPNAATEAALVKVEPVVAEVAPIVEAAVPAVAPEVAAASGIVASAVAPVVAPPTAG